MRFTDEVSQKLQSVIDAAVQDDSNDIPGLTFIVVAKDGSQPFTHSAGRRGINSKDALTPESVFWIASCTKMVTGICCMQLVEKGILKLDDSEQLESLCPELKDLTVLKEDGTTEAKKKGITLRMLLTHTAGFGYTFFNERLRDRSYPAGFDEVGGNFYDIKQPLLFQPGEGWQYGVNIDWAGVALERVTGTRLNDYMQKHVIQPLGLENVGMFPTPEMKKNLAHMHYRGPDGKLQPQNHLLRRPLIAETDAEKDAIFHSGGAGLFANPSEYGRIISALLNNGTCPRTNAKILDVSTVDEMFTNQITQFPNFGRQGIPAAKQELTNPIPDMYPNGGQPQGWGLTFMITGGVTGRSSGTGWWAGLSNLYWWADREKGVGGMIASQIVPFGDAKVLGTWFQLEGAVYEALASA